MPKEQVICINDGSTDTTRTVLNKEDCYSHHFIQNQGKGACLKKGFELALARDASGVLTIDADLQHSPEELPKFQDAASSFDIVIGSRREPNQPFGKPMPLNRRFSNTITSVVLTRLCNQPVWDSQCGYRLISAPCIEEILPLCHETGFMFETEFLLHAASRGYKIGFVGIETIYTSAKSHMRYATDTLNFIKLIFRHAALYSAAKPETTPRKVISQ
jgi:glycosyltransferase involved in cell wall biosynthesis